MEKKEVTGRSGAVVLNLHASERGVFGNILQVIDPLSIELVRCLGRGVDRAAIQTPHRVSAPADA